MLKTEKQRNGISLLKGNTGSLLVLYISPLSFHHSNSPIPLQLLCASAEGNVIYSVMLHITLLLYIVLPIERKAISSFPGVQSEDSMGMLLCRLSCTRSTAPGGTPVSVSAWQCHPPQVQGQSEVSPPPGPCCWMWVIHPHSSITARRKASGAPANG